ncbi:MAG: sialidase family protein [Planctomycetota bacterium]
MHYNREVAPIVIHRPLRLPVREIPVQRIPLGDPGDYKPSMALFPDGQIVLVADRAVGSTLRGDFLNTTPLWRSTDGGLSWSGPQILEDAPGKETFISATSKGVLFMTCVTMWGSRDYEGDPGDNTGYYSILYRSTDRGNTWQCTKVQLTEEEARAIGASKPEPCSMGYGTNLDRAPLELPDGTLLLGVAHANSRGGYLWRSDDDGATWDKSRQIHISGWYHNWDGFFSNSFTYRQDSGKLKHFIRVGWPSRMTPIRDGRPTLEEGSDHFDRTMISESLDGGITWSPARDFGDYGQMYCRVLRLRDGRRLLTYTQRGVTWPLGLHAILSCDDGETWDFQNDQIIIEGFTPWGAPSGGGFGNTLELPDGALLSCYSYTGTDSQTHLEVVRWRIPWSRDERIIYYDRRLFDASRRTGLVSLYDWRTEESARLIARDYPYVEAAQGEQSSITKGPLKVDDEQFSAEIRIKSREETRCNWRGLTLTDLSITDWSPYAGVLMRFHNATARTLEVSLAVRDETGTSPSVRPVSLLPGETRDVFSTIDELRAHVNTSDVRTVALACVDPREVRGLMVSPLYLVERKTASDM